MSGRVFAAVSPLCLATTSIIAIININTVIVKSKSQTSLGPLHSLYLLALNTE